MRELLGRLWPFPWRRWPLAVVMVVGTSLVGCLATRLWNVVAGIGAHLAAMAVVVTVLAIRSLRSTRRQRREWEAWH